MSNLSPKARDLVRAGQRALQPTDADRTRLTSAMRARLGDAALRPDVGQVASTAAAGHALWPLVSAVLVSVGILGGALFSALRPGTGRDTPQAASIAPVSAATPAIDPVVAVAAPSAEQPTSPAATPATTSAHRSQDRLAAEVAILSRATHDLRAGRPAEALKSLDEYRRKFPKGLLSEEHRAARAQALCALGRFDEANAKLAELAPRSPLAVQAKQFCDAKLAAR